MHAVGGGCVLNQFDQMIAVDHLAGTARDLDSGAEGFGAGGRAPVALAFGIIGEIERAAHEVGAALVQRCRGHFRIGGDEIDRRGEVQQLTRKKGQQFLVVAADAVDAGGGVVPPLLVEQEGLLHHVVGPLLPGRTAKAPVLR